ncbi:MAG TPA: ABC transporter permease [Terracidiphilus sp.]|nr:ABC transporter permease [Terracidiphilus sp.]
MSIWKRMRPDARKAELDEELQAHLRMAMEERIANGEPAEEARAAAMRELGNLPLIEDVTRSTWRWARLESLTQDVRFALRQMRRAPGFAISVIGILALGIAAAAAMFTVVDHVLLRPLPFRDAGRLVKVEESSAKTGLEAEVTWPDLAQWVAQSRSFEQFGFYRGVMGRSFLDSKSTSLQVQGTAVSTNLFSVLGVRPLLGRDFIQESAGFTPGKNGAVVMLSHAAWQAAFGGDPAIVGKSVRINNGSYTVIGVMPPGLEIPAHALMPQVWLPLVLGNDDKERTYMSPGIDVIGRLRDGVPAASADAEMKTIQKRLGPGYSDAESRANHASARVRLYSDTLVEADLRKALLALLAASGVLWLIASVNVTNLLLARGAARQREIAMRGALGAARMRIVQQFLVESLLLSGIAAVLGTAVALIAVRISRSAVPETLHVDLSAHLNLTILGVLCGLTIVTALVSSAWPAWLAVRSPIEPALRQGSMQAGSGRGHNRMRSVLVGTEVAMSLTLLVACGLLLRTIYSLRHVPLGYRTDHIVIAHMALPAYRYEGQNMVVNLYEPLLDRVNKLHGAEAAGYISQVPLGHSFNITLTLLMNGNNIRASLKPVSPSLQRIFGFKMLAGRFFNDGDTATSAPVVVVNRAFARLYTPNKHDPAAVIGTRFMNMRKNTTTTVIGVLDDERQTTIEEPSQPEVEFALPQLTTDSGFYQPSTVAMDLAVRTDLAPDAMIPEIRDLLRQTSPELANATFTTMDQVVEDSFGSQRLAAHLLEIFGGAALLIAVGGLYGLLAWVVTQRTREMGVRVALGAGRASLLWLVLRQAGWMLLAGVAVGTGLAFGAGRLLRGYLFGVSTHDAWTMAGAALLLFASGMLAAYLPARRAARVDPMVALRTE